MKLFDACSEKGNFDSLVTFVNELRGMETQRRQKLNSRKDNFGVEVLAEDTRAQQSQHVALSIANTNSA